MKALLDNRFAPITFSWGFVEAPFEEYSTAFISWWNQLSISFNSVGFDEDFSKALLRLEPLQSPQNRYLIVETKSRWTAIFSNGLRANDVASPVGHLSKILNCRGVRVCCIPDRSELENRSDALQIYGCVAFVLHGSVTTGPLNDVRQVSFMNDGGEWKFTLLGEAQPYEQVTQYSQPRIRDRFTSEMLESYCAALGIQAFDSKFYGLRGVLLDKLTKLPNVSPQMSTADARAKLYL
jgi:hypothetical protein